MKPYRPVLALAAALSFAACDHSPTQPQNLLAQLDAVDPVVLTFAASDGLPGAPFHPEGGPPHIGGPMVGIPGAMGPGGPGAPLPDSLKLSDAQKASMDALVHAFETANAADLAALRAIHDAAHEAMKAGKSRDDVKAILDSAKPILDRLKPAADALHTAIQGVLTAAQRAWIDAHKPDHPPRTP